jgi:hypothetical protein
MAQASSALTPGIPIPFSRNLTIRIVVICGISGHVKTAIGRILSCTIYRLIYKALPESLAI